MIAWLVGVAIAQEPACNVELTPPPGRVSVAWISTLGARTGANGWLTVVPTAALRQYTTSERPGVGRLLQHLGERRRSSDPRRRYKITIFDVDSDALCRPIAGADEQSVVGGLPACPESKAKINAAYSGCGVLVDRGTGEDSLPVFKLTWAEAAFDGFCVLPVERFLDSK